MSHRLAKLATRLDTLGARRRLRRFRTGWPARTSDDVRFYQSPKVQYRYRERGAGPTIVFTVDPPATLELYDDLLALFATRFRVLAVELPAMGFSAPRGSYRFGWRETNDDLVHWLRDVAGERSILAFSCVAGLAAVDIAVRHPSLVEALVLLQTGTVDAFARWKALRDPKGILARPFLGQVVMKSVAPKRMPAWYRLAVGNEEKIGRFCACARESFRHGAMWSLASAYQTYMDPSITLGTPTQPVLAIWGLADRSHPPENAESPRAFSDDVMYVALPRLGHFSELEDPQAVFDTIVRFIDGV